MVTFPDCAYAERKNFQLGVGMEPVSRRDAEAQSMMENDLNFGEAMMKTGISRGVNGLQERVSLRLRASARSFDFDENKLVSELPLYSTSSW